MRGWWTTVLNLLDPHAAERIRLHKAALNVALAYAEGELPTGTPEATLELLGCRVVLEEE